ncbi:MAG: aminopeptidase, partial [Lachnospiraceae bacterium]
MTKRKNAWDTYGSEDLKKLEEINLAYRYYLDHGKTERECIAEVIRMAEEAGYIDLDVVVKKGEQLKVGDKVYSAYMSKTIALYQIGEDPIEQGINILGAHVDSPRIDVKQNPLFEENG